MAHAIKFLSSPVLNSIPVAYSIPKLSETTDYRVFPHSRRYRLNPFPNLGVSTTISKALVINLDFARRAINYVNQNILHCDTFPSRLKNAPSRKELFLARDLVEKLRAKSLTGIDEIRGILRYKAGNCDEMSQLAVYFLERSCKIYPELYQIKRGDHIFIVIGRELISDPEDFKSWGNSAVICDVWANSFYPASLIPKYLCAYVGTDIVSGQAIVERFDPERHTLTSRSDDTDSDWDSLSSISSSGNSLPLRPI